VEQNHRRGVPLERHVGEEETVRRHRQHYGKGLGASFVHIAERARGWLPWVVAALVMPAVFGCGGEAARRAEDGVLDLRSASFDGVLTLQGEWRARAGVDSAAFAGFDYDDAHWQRVTVPGTFRRQGFPEDGLVWYRLRLRLPPDAPPLKGFVLYANTAYTLYAARPGAPPQAVAMSGVADRSPARLVRSRHAVAFDVPRAPEVVLAWKVANHAFHDGGPFHPIEFGAASVIDGMLRWRTALAFTAFGLYLLLSLLFLFYWAWRWDDLRALSVGLVAVVMAVNTLTTSGMLDALMPETLSFNLRITLEAVSYLSLNGLFALVLMAFLPQEFAPVSVGPLRLGTPPEPGRADGLRVFFTVSALLAMVESLVLTVAALAGSPLVTSHLMAINRWAALALMIPAAGIVGHAMWRRRPMVGVFAPGFALALLGGVHDVLLAMGYLPGHPYLAAYLFLGFMLFAGYVIVRGNVLAQRKALTLQEAVEQRSKKLRAAAIAMQASKMAEGQFLAAVSHELRTPLASILGYTQMLESELNDRLELQHREFLQTIRVSAERLLLLINDILDLARLDAGKVELRPSLLEVRPLVEEVVRQLYPLAAQKQLFFEARFEEGVAYVYADAMRLRQVLVNLLSNAIKFTERGGVTLHATPAKLGDRPAVALSVHDTGPGISPDFLPRIFDRFTQEERLSGKHQGSGLGLTIARELTLRMGGQITVESKLDRGSTFTVVLPAAPPPRSEEVSPEDGRAGVRERKGDRDPQEKTP